MNSSLSLIVVILQLVYAFFPSMDIQSTGTISANKIPASYELQLNTKDQTFDMSLNMLLSTILQIKANKDEVSLTGKAGDFSFSSKDILDSLEPLLAHRTNTQLSWDNLQDYITNSEYVDDIQTILQWVSAANVVLPVPEKITQDGRILNHISMNARDMCKLFKSYISSLTTPTFYAEKLEKLHIWDRLGVKAAPNLRYMRYLLDELSDRPWTIFYYLYFLDFQLDLFWSTEYCEEELAFLPIRLPKSVKAQVTFLDYRYDTQWNIHIKDNELTGIVEYNGQQPCSFSLKNTKDGLRLDIEYSPDSRYYYQLSMIYYHDQLSFHLPAIDMQNQTMVVKREDFVPLVTFYFAAGEKLNYSYKMFEAQTMQGSIFRTGQKYNANIRILDKYSAQNNIYEISVDLQQLTEEQNKWNMLWSINGFNYALVPTMEYSGDINIASSLVDN